MIAKWKIKPNCPSVPDGSCRRDFEITEDFFPTFATALISLLRPSKVYMIFLPWQQCKIPDSSPIHNTYLSPHPICPDLSAVTQAHFFLVMTNEDDEKYDQTCNTKQIWFWKLVIFVVLLQFLSIFVINYVQPVWRWAWKLLLFFF